MHRLETAELNIGHSAPYVSNGHTYDGWQKGPNSVGGISIKHRIYNCSAKDMKYITFTYVAYNAVNDVVPCRTTGRTEAVGKLTGPFKVGADTEVIFENLWYNSTIETVKIKDVKIQYMDDTEETVAGDEIKDIYAVDSEFSKTHKSEAAQIRMAMKTVGWINKLFKKG